VGVEGIKMADNEKIEELKRKIEDLKKRLPAHSIPPSMIAELDELEEQLEEALKKQANEDQLI
jgi:chaperonin cofactor prefoldin